MQMTKRKGLAAMLAAAGGVAIAQQGLAGTIAFNNGGGDGQYSNPANWAGGHVPGDTANGGSAGDTIGAAAATPPLVIYLNSPEPNVLDARIANGGTAPLVTINVSNTASLLIVGDAAGLGGNNTGAGFTLGRQNGGTAIVNISGGTLATAAADATGVFSVGNIVNGSGFATGVLNMSGGTVSSAQNFVVGDGGNATFKAVGMGTQTAGAVTAGGAAGAGSVIIGNNGIGSYTISGGSLTQSGTGTNLSGNGTQTATLRVGFYVGRNANSQGTFVQSGGVVNVSNGLYLADGNNAKGSYTISGGTLNLAGELRVAPSTVDVGNATTLTGNSATFSIVGHAAPAITANSLVADTGGSTLNFSIDSSTGTTPLNVVAGTVGGVAYDGIAHLATATQVDVDNVSGFTPGAGSRYTLLTAASISALPTLVLDGDAFDTSALSIVTNGDGTQSLVASFAAVPEPGSLAALALGGLALAGRRRRRR